MTNTELALMKQYEWIIPKQPVPLGQVIENSMQIPKQPWISFII